MGKAVGWRTDVCAWLPKNEGASTRIWQPSLSPSTADLRTQRNDKPSYIPYCRCSSNSCGGKKKDPQNEAQKLALVDMDGAEPAWSSARMVFQVDIKINSGFRETTPF